MTLAQIIEAALWSALERHAHSAFGTVAQLVPAPGPGKPAKVAGAFFFQNVCQDVAAAVEASYGERMNREVSAAVDAVYTAAAKEISNA